MDTLSFTHDNLPEAVAMLNEKLENIERLILKNSESEQRDELLTVSETAEFLNLSIATIYSKVSRGELPAMKSGKRLYFSTDELTATIKAGRKSQKIHL